MPIKTTYGGHAGGEHTFDFHYAGRGKGVTPTSSSHGSGLFDASEYGYPPAGFKIYFKADSGHGTTLTDGADAQADPYRDVLHWLKEIAYATHPCQGLHYGFMIGGRTQGTHPHNGPSGQNQEDTHQMRRWSFASDTYHTTHTSHRMSGYASDNTNFVYGQDLGSGIVPWYGSWGHGAHNNTGWENILSNKEMHSKTQCIGASGFSSPTGMGYVVSGGKSSGGYWSSEPGDWNYGGDKIQKFNMATWGDSGTVGNLQGAKSDGSYGFKDLDGAGTPESTYSVLHDVGTINVYSGNPASSWQYGHRSWASAWQSMSHGIVAGGSYHHSTMANSNDVSWFTFANDSDAVSVATLATPGRASAAFGNDLKAGYSIAGRATDDLFGSNTEYDSKIIDKMNFGSMTTSIVSNGETDTGGHRWGGNVSPIAIYSTGKSMTSPSYDKFVFVTELNQQNIGDLTMVMHHCNHMNSLENGYIAGGKVGYDSILDDFIANIDVISFTSDTTSSKIGDISGKHKDGGAAQACTTHF